MVVFLFHYFNIKEGTLDNIFCNRFASLFRGAGYLGVDFFFTLSGFLITSVLIAVDGFDLGRFYLRRGLRIIPLYLVIVIAGYLILPYLLGQKLNLPPVGYLLTFTANCFYAWHGDKYLFAITILWSLSVEMQFYLVWGAVLRFMKPYIYPLAAILIIASVIVKYCLYGNCSLYYSTVSYVPDFMMGAMGAKLLYDKAVNLVSVNKVTRLLVYIIAGVVFVSDPYLYQFIWWKIGGNCVYSLLAMGIIIDQSTEGSLFEAGRYEAISYLGKVSYGIYCFQGLILPMYSKAFGPHFATQGAVVNTFIIPLALFIITILVAIFSYRYFESYFLHLKERT